MDDQTLNYLLKLTGEDFKSALIQDKIEFFKSEIRTKLLLIIQKHNQVTRNQFIDLLNLPRTTIYDNLRKLIIDKKIGKFVIYGINNIGRPEVYFCEYTYPLYQKLLKADFHCFSDEKAIYGIPKY